MKNFDNDISLVIGLNDYCNRYNSQFHEAVSDLDMSVECAIDMITCLSHYYDTDIIVSPPLPLLRANGLSDNDYLTLLEKWDENTIDYLETRAKNLASRLLKEEETIQWTEWDDGSKPRDYTEKIKILVSEIKNGRLPIARSNEAILFIYDKYLDIYKQIEELKQQLISGISINSIDITGPT